MEGVVNEVPVAKATPPDEAANQEIVPADAVAPRFSVPVPQLAAGAVEVIAGMVFTLATMAVLGEAVHVPSYVST